jgi:Tetratricopeptide repeat
MRSQRSLAPAELATVSQTIRPNNVRAQIPERRGVEPVGKMAPALADPAAVRPLRSRRRNLLSPNTLCLGKMRGVREPARSYLGPETPLDDSRPAWSGGSEMRCGLAMLMRCAVLGALAASMPSTPLTAITGLGESEQAPPGDDNYAAGKAAFERQDWQGVIDHMSRVIDERPWDDDAHNLMGFAYRKLGNYEQALEHYDRALTLNPHHRGALEYLGEAYLELDRPDLAKGMLDRLRMACQRIAASTTDDGRPAGCEEWQELNEAYLEYLAGGAGE